MRYLLVIGISLVSFLSPFLVTVAYGQEKRSCWLEVSGFDKETNVRIAPVKGFVHSNRTFTGAGTEPDDGLVALRFGEGDYHIELESPGYQKTILRYSLQCERTDMKYRVQVPIPLQKGELNDVAHLRFDQDSSQIVRDDYEYLWYEKVVDEFRTAIKQGKIIASVTVKILSLTKPDYPEEARKKGISGEVVVVVKVNEAGEIVNAYVASGPKELHETALKAARSSIYSPATENGVAVIASMAITFNFVINIVNGPSR